MGKTTYILGAGFSIEAGAPSQEKLIGEIFNTYKEKSDFFNKSLFDKFDKFLTNTLGIPEEEKTKVSLEDIFTPIDRAILDNIVFRDLSVDKLRDVRGAMQYVISRTFDLILTDCNKDYIEDFARFIVERCSKRANGKYKNNPNLDSVAILSTNWDILLDNSIKDVLEHSHTEPKGVVDYCCYISSYEENDNSIKPGLEVLGEGGFNVKLLKLHGSLNWLQCPRCQRLYVAFNQKIAINENPKLCRHCEKNFGDGDSHKLISNLIMPTFLKDLSNPQYKIIWQNAGIELSESDHIVFIGYSLPFADFEMRQLLSRMVRKDAEITVVGYRSKDSKEVEDMKSRYKIFFGNRDIKFRLEGAKAYISSIVNNPKS